MAQVAHRINGLLLPERRSSHAHSSQVDVNFQTRLSSLLLSQHGRHPRAPCPSPNSTDTPGDFYEGSHSTRAEAHAFNVNGTIAKLAQLGSNELGLIASGFDGPASQYGDPNLSYRRRLSQPEIEDTIPRKKDISEDNSDLNQYMNGDSLGQGLYGSGVVTPKPAPVLSTRPMSISSKMSTGSRMPFYNLQTIAPGVAKGQKPEKLHIPGSYQSDTETSTLQSFKTLSPSDRDVSMVDDLMSEPTQSIPHPNAEIRSLAVEALMKTQVRDLAGIPLNPNPRLRKEPSQGTLMSTTSTQHTLHLLSKPAASQLVFGKVAEPIMTPGVGHGHVSSENQQVPSLLKDPHGIESRRPSLTPSNLSSLDDEGASTINHPASTRSSYSDISNILEPPIAATKHQMYEHDDDPLTPDQAKTPQPLHFPNVLLNRRKSVAPSVISKTSSADIRNIITPDVPNFDSARTSVVGPAFEIPGKLVPYQTSIISSSKGKEKKLSLEEGTSALSSHSLPINGKSDTALDVTSIQGQEGSPIPADESESGLKIHWIRQLLASASTNSLFPNNQSINAHLSHRSSYATNKPLIQEVETPESNEGPKAQSNVPDDSASNEKPKKLQQQHSTEPFAQAILDLESLLREALLIAKQAVDPGSSVKDLPATEYPIKHEGRHSHVAKSSDSSYGSSNSNESFSSQSEGADEEAQYTTLPTKFQDNTGFQSKTALNPDTAPRSRRSLAQALNQPQLVLPTFDEIGTERPRARENAVRSHHRLPQEIDGIDNEPVVTRELLSQNINLSHPETAVNKSHTIDAYDWALVTQPAQSSNLQPLKSQTSSAPMKPHIVPLATTEQHVQKARENQYSSTLASEPSMRLGINSYQRPSIQPRTSSVRLRPQKAVESQVSIRGFLNESPSGDAQKTDPQASKVQHSKRPQPGISSKPERGYSYAPSIDPTPEGGVLPTREHEFPFGEQGVQKQDSLRGGYSLRGRRHVSLRGTSGFSLTQSHKRAPLARDWSPSRKRYVATVTCINTALMGLIIGIYAGEVPAIQYAIVDEHHYTILGNVVFFLGLAITTVLAWPLPLLHGRKPYTLAAFALILPLQFPQAIAVGKPRSPYVATYRIGLLLPRAIAGIVMGFANINFKTTLLDLFGASLQSAHPHQETVNIHDVRRHGGGMGVWLGIWTWCSIGSIGVGFLIGAVVIGELDVAWGFWLSIILTASALVINVFVPEVRRSAYRRSMAEVRQGSDVSRRVARGEIKMHLDSTGPMWWGEELLAGQKLCLRMVKQPGFAILALYIGWIYGQIIMIIVVSH